MAIDAVGGTGCPGSGPRGVPAAGDTALLGSHVVCSVVLCLDQSDVAGSLSGPARSRWLFWDPLLDQAHVVLHTQVSARAGSRRAARFI